MAKISTNFRRAVSAVVFASTLVFSVSQAGAVSLSVKRACIGDYLSYCSAHSVGSSSLRQCMRDAGPRLSRGCVNALVAAGEVSKAEVSRRSARR
ncbi:conserved exported protein of unknown function [Candidatus Filomicrobium marinum]|uniref:Uncharacterized protein n=1 Tax=Candidatus Filomicrobium marinum TaxID=1608628 RepID=A0A0D6JB87_9HYPH|nr:hypothetical protein [Candidatus Filomicrobium marinum]CFX01745.1 conserved exported protein of unknown function [Candidatus Filomicrobium marinum]CPR15500.1 conserved exported protein of unknown function [Candidatus Filomicrobium marinum]